MLKWEIDKCGFFSDTRPREMTLADVAAIKVKATRHHNEIKRMNALKSKAKGRKASDTVRQVDLNRFMLEEETSKGQCCLSLGRHTYIHVSCHSPTLSSSGNP